MGVHQEVASMYPTKVWTSSAADAGRPRTAKATSVVGASGFDGGILCSGFEGGRRRYAQKEIQMSNEKDPGCLGYLEDYTTQFCGE